MPSNTDTDTDTKQHQQQNGTPATPPLHTIQVPNRPRKTVLQFLHGVAFLTVFNLCCILINAFQIMFMLPLKAFRYLDVAERVYDEGIRYTKGAFGVLITLACQVFAPSTLRVTFETEGPGKFTPEEIENIVVRDASGNVVQLRLPQKLVLIANHQMYADWWYVWCLTYFMDMHRDVLIVLKKSLKWIPILGWGMQIFRFIFLARSWASDRLYLAAQLSKLGRKAEQQDNPFALIIYPEGTLVSKDTRPVSKKYADKMGIQDMAHTLLPRSTGLQYSLRSLAPRLPTLKLLDITVAYPGIPPYGYGQSYYTLRSIFMDRVPPPVIHMHLRLFDVSTSVPIGDLSNTDPTKLPPTSPPPESTNGHEVANGNGVENGNGHAKTLTASSSSDTSSSTSTSAAHVIEVDVPERERVKFDEWLRALWREKDVKFDEYHAKGGFPSGVAPVEIPLRIRSGWEVMDVVCWFTPVVFWVVWWVSSRASC